MLIGYNLFVIFYKAFKFIRVGMFCFVCWKLILYFDPIFGKGSWMRP